MPRITIILVKEFTAGSLAGLTIRDTTRGTSRDVSGWEALIGTPIRAIGGSDYIIRGVEA